MYIEEWLKIIETSFWSLIHLICKYPHKLTVKCVYLKDYGVRWIALLVTVSDNRRLGLVVSIGGLVFLSFR